MFPIDIDFSRLKEVLTYDPQAPMIFSSGIFLWLFAAFMVVYVLLQRKYTARILFVTLFSYYFYYKSSGTYFFLLAIVTVADFFLAQLMDRAEGYWKRKGLVVLSLSINEDVVLSLISDMLKAIAEYAKHDRAEFIRVVQEAQSSQQTAEVRKQRTRLATAKQRVSELEVLLCKIYEDNILGKLSDSRYEMLDAQYAKEQGELTAEIFALEKAVKGYEKHEKDADRFIALIDKYENFDTLTVTMLNEFVEKILVHERDRKGSRDTTQEVEIYFNFVGRFVPPAFGEVELTPEELEEIRKKEERKDRLHQNYLKRKANGKQKEYEERTKAKKKAEIEARKAAIRTEDIAKGVFIPVSSLPQREPQKGAKTA